MTSTALVLTTHDRELLAGLPRHEQAALLLRGTTGPLVALPFPPDVAATAYLVHCAYRAARRPGQMLAGRPFYEAAETLLNRVLTVAQSSGSLREFGHLLHERLGRAEAWPRPRRRLDRGCADARRGVVLVRLRPAAGWVASGRLTPRPRRVTLSP